MSASPTFPVIGTIGATSTDAFAEDVRNPVSSTVGDFAAAEFVTGQAGAGVGQDINDTFTGLFGQLRGVALVVVALAAIVALGQLFNVQVG